MYALAYDEFRVIAVLQSFKACLYFFKLLNAAARLQYNAGSEGLKRTALKVNMNKNFVMNFIDAYPHNDLPRTYVTYFS